MVEELKPQLDVAAGTAFSDPVYEADLLMGVTTEVFFSGPDPRKMISRMRAIKENKPIPQQVGEENQNA